MRIIVPLLRRLQYVTVRMVLLILFRGKVCLMCVRCCSKSIPLFVSSLPSWFSDSWLLCTPTAKYLRVSVPHSVSSPRMKCICCLAIKPKFKWLQISSSYLQSRLFWCYDPCSLHIWCCPRALCDANAFVNLQIVSVSRSSQVTYLSLFCFSQMDLKSCN